jgi:hypothetical protein
MQYAYRLSSAQNVWQDSRLAAGGISAPSLWYLKNFCTDSNPRYHLIFCCLYLDINIKRERFRSNHYCIAPWPRSHTSGGTSWSPSSAQGIRGYGNTIRT